MTRARDVVGAWATRPPIRLAEADSTQTEARSLAEAGAPEGTVVSAEHQTRGRGRGGRRWVDEPGAALLMSIILRPAAEVSRLPQLSLVAAVAVAEAAGGETGLRIALDWPNDVLVGGRKVAGILAESFAARDGRVVVILGIGVNVNQRYFPPDLAERATALALECGHALDREKLLQAVLERLEAWYRRWMEEGFLPIREAWRRASATLGRRVTINEGVGGMALDLAEDGALLVKTDTGAVIRHVAGSAEGEQDAPRH